MNEVAPVDAAAFFTKARFLPIVGDYCQPLLEPGDFAAVTPADAYDGEGIYCLDLGTGTPALYHARRVFGTGEIEFHVINPAYGKWRRPLAEFNQLVVGKVFATMRIIDHGELRRLAAP